MAIFSKGRGLFGAPMNADKGASPDAALIQREATVPTYKKPSTAQFIAGTVGDALQNWSGGQGTFLPAIHMQQQQAAEAAQYQQRRADDYTDWERKQQYAAAHPKPQGPTELSQRIAELNQYKQGLGDTYAQNYANNGGGVPQIANIPGVGMVSIPRTPAAPAIGGSVPEGAISYLRQNPGMAAQFDAKYGQGASQRYLGGAAPQAQAPFPIR